MSSCRNVVVLGSTGSIGHSALKVARELPERMKVVGLAANRSVSKIAEQAGETEVAHVGLADSSCAVELEGSSGAG